MNLIIVKVVIKLHCLNSDRHLLVTIFFTTNGCLVNVLGGLFSLLVVVFPPHIQKRRASPDLGKKTCD
jgi:hypothetical protein